MTSWLLQFVTDYHIKIKLAAQFSVPLLHFTVYIYTLLLQYRPLKSSDAGRFCILMDSFFMV